MLEKYRRRFRGSWLWRASFGAFVFGSLSTLAGESAATEASTAAKGNAEGTRARGPSLRFALERSYGQWERLYDGEWAGESGGARFSGSASEGLWGWRGRGELVFGELAHFCGKFGASSITITALVEANSTSVPSSFSDARAYGVDLELLP